MAMAQTPPRSREKLNHHAHNLRDKLEVLGCPYTDGVDADWITDLLFKPGEHRIRLLQWLFSKFDSQLNDVLDPHFVTLDTRMDSRIQRLLFVASSLGLCASDEADLIRGVGSVSRQFAFMDQLLDHVYIIDRSEDPQARSMKSPGMISEGMSIKEQVYNDCWFMDSLAEQEKLCNVLTSEAKLLPPDITKHLGLVTDENTASPELPNSNELQKTVDELGLNLRRQQEILEQLQKMHEFPRDDRPAIDNMQKTLRLVLTEVSQLLVGFSYCYENEIHQWCNKSAPQLNQLGPTFKRIHSLLSHFTQMLSASESVRSSHQTLCSQLPQKVRGLSTNLDRSSDGSSTVNSLQECISILKESLDRTEAVSMSHSAQNSSILSGVVRLR